MISPSITSRENNLLGELEGRGLLVFTPIDAANMLGESRENIHRILSRMQKKGLLYRLERGKYISADEYHSRSEAEVACNIMTASYVSLWSGLNHYGYTTQVPRTVFIMLAYARKPIELPEGKGNVRFMKTRHFFGYRRLGHLVIAEPEKLFLDCLQFPRYSGGGEEILESFENAVDDIDLSKMIENGLMMNNKALTSRLGYMLERSGVDFEPKALLDNISKSYVPFDPGARTGRKNAKWKIIENSG